MKPYGVSHLPCLCIHVGPENSYAKGIKELGKITVGHAEHNAGYDDCRFLSISQQPVHDQLPEKKLLHHRGHNDRCQQIDPQAGISDKLVQFSVIRA